ncbi:MAG: hypothetical protein JWL77_3996 [Chthonomonadaceae bacterium]|nr:hypothetical protein [Chthonomonadaceae bacterium]
MGKEPPESAGLELRLFGVFEACRNRQPIVGLHRRKGERLLVYLALRAGQWVETRKLASEFWGGSPTDDPAANLRQSLAYLRQLLEADAVCLESRPGGVLLRLREEQADTLRFEAACERGDVASLALARQLSEETLLMEWDDAWILPFRDRFERKLQAALARLKESEDKRVETQSPPLNGLPTASTTSSPAQEPQNGAAGGAVLLESPFYIARDADTALYTAIQHRESIVLLKGARQTGKSSLLARGLQFARQSGRTVYHIDCEQFSPEDLVSRDQFYLRMIALLAEQAEQEFVPETDWKAHLGANGNLERFLRRRILGSTRTPILWALDGVDRLFKTGYYNEFFALLRGLHSRRATEPDVPWNRLTILIAAATEAHLYIRDLSQSPFNVGTRITLEDFDPVQCAELLRSYGLKTTNDVEQQNLRELLGGHPYLLARGLQEMRDRDIDSAAFAQLALRPDGPYHDHLEGILRLLSADANLHTDLRSVLDGHPCSPAGFFRLRTAGILSGNSVEDAHLRCGLYARYFGLYLR